MKTIGVEVQRLFRTKKHGMEVVALELLKELQQIHNNNQYVVYVKNDADSQCLTPSENLSIKTLPGKTYFDWEQFSLPKAIKQTKPTFLHATCNTSALNIKVPLVLTLHDIIYLEEINFKGTAYQNFGNLYRKFVVPKAVKKSEMIITVSHFERETIMEKLKVPADRITVVYNAVNRKFNNQYPVDELAAFKAKYKLPENFILFLGNTAPKKNTNNVIAAYIEYCKTEKDHFPLVILDYDENLIRNILVKHNSLHLISNFIFPGFITSNQMALMYNAANLFLYPSLRESFGLPILEAMGCGTPVITANTSSMPEVAGGAAILVNPYDVSEMAAQMAKVLTDTKMLNDLSAKGLQRASTFTWKKSAKDLLSIYHLM